MDNRKGPSFYELLGPFSFNEESLLSKLGINKKLFENKNSYSCEPKKTIWIGKISDELPDGHGIFIMSEPKVMVIVVDAKDGQKDGMAKIYFEDGSYF